MSKKILKIIKISNKSFILTFYNIWSPCISGHGSEWLFVNGDGKWDTGRLGPRWLSKKILHCWCCLVTQSCPTLCKPMDCSTPGFPVLHYFLEFAQTHVHWVSDAIQPSHPLLSPFPPAFNLFQHQGLFERVDSLHQVVKVLEFQLQISPSNDYSGLISFRMVWLDLLAVQGTLKTLLQYHSSKASILPCSAFFIVQLSHPYMTTRKTIALTRQTFVG